MVWKGAQERFRETLLFSVNPPDKGAGTVSFLGTDTVTSGNWIDAAGNRTYGNQAFMLPIRLGRALYQDPSVFLSRVAAIPHGADANQGDQEEASGSLIAWETTRSSADSRVPWSGPNRKAREPIAFASYHLKLSLKVDCLDAVPHQFSLYMLDYLRSGLPVDVDIFDTEGHRLESRKIEGAALNSGVYVKYRVTGSVYVSIVSLSSHEITLSGMFMDPVL